MQLARFLATMASHAAAAALTPRVSRKVAVIGGGSAGVVAARYLKRGGHEPTLFEAGATFGGVWAPAPTNDVVYKSLRTNLPTVVMQSPDLDFAEGLPSYVDAEALGAYIERYAAEFGVDAVARFGATVTSVAPVDGAWTVAWDGDGGCRDERFDAVVVANGHYNRPYEPEIAGQAAWLAAGGDRSISHSQRYDEPSSYAGKAVLVVGGRSSGVDLARELRGVASWVYVMEKKCAEPYGGDGVTHVPVGAELTADGRMKVGESYAPGPAVDRVLLATGYVYDFPFFEEEAVDMTFEGRRSCRPLYLHLQHAARPTLGFVGVQLSVPCPIPFFEAQALYLAEALAAPDAALAARDERDAWVDARLATVAASGREQDLHYTSAEGDNAWAYIRRLVDLAGAPQVDGDPSWLQSPAFDHRLKTVESVYDDRGRRYPTKPWHDDAYRRCDYAVDWAAGTWTVDASRC